MIRLPKIGIDPGVSNGCFSIFNNGEIINIKMVEDFRDMMKILKPFGGAPDDTRVRCSVERIYINPYGSRKINANMQSLKTNYERIQDALYACNIPFQIVEARVWQSYFSLTLPKGIGEKGLNYNELEKWKKEFRHLKIHLSIENNVLNDELIVDDVRYILETNGKEAARKALCDDFTYFTKYSLTTAINETEHAISKFKTHETKIRKDRYHKFISKKLLNEGYDKKVHKYQADSLIILLYEILNPHE